MRGFSQNRADELIGKINKKFEKLVKNLDSKETENEIKNYLKFAGEFHNYSLRNQMLIADEAMSRGTTIEHIASFKTWSQLKNSEGKKASVKKGEKGFSILVPISYIKYELDKNRKYILDENGKKIPKRDELGNIEKGLKFKVGTVFDVNQTTAKEIGAYKTLDYRTKIDIDASLFKKLSQEISEKFNVVVSHEPTGNVSKGYYSYAENKIVVDPSYSVSEKISTLFHELGHHQIHGKQFQNGTLNYKNLHKDRGAREGEAEAFSYILSSLSGIENKSELYIKTWGNDAKDLKERFTLIVGTAKEAIKKLNLEKIISKEQINDNKKTEEFESSILKDLKTVQQNQNKDIEITRSR
jgi:antirestriction protein ArdC